MHRDHKLQLSHMFQLCCLKVGAKKIDLAVATGPMSTQLVIRILASIKLSQYAYVDYSYLPEK